MAEALKYLFDLPAQHDSGARKGVTSVCSAHPLVIEAALTEAAETGDVALIEATCNQVNQDGGYTGMTPPMFRDFVLEIAVRVGFAPERILFGGDHLGPNPWRKLPAAVAMTKALAMVAAYAEAGFSKIHLDASMACGDDLEPLSAAVIADRAALLAGAGERGARAGGHPPPAYIIGTEVPVPGGVAEELETLQATSPASAEETLTEHRRAFSDAGLEPVLERCIGLVVQPGVEFGNVNVIGFEPEGAAELAGWRDRHGGIIFEAHSTDYQTAEALAALVTGGFAILKVGPGLTFALREALYGLDQIAGAMREDYTAGSLMAAMEELMMGAPEHWQAYYRGNSAEQRVQRHFSYSDRIRYYWTRPEAETAVHAMFAALEGVEIPTPLVSQFLPRQYRGVMEGSLPAQARALALAAVRTALAPYSEACAGDGRVGAS